MNAAIEIQNLTKWYRGYEKTPAIRDVSLEVQENSIFGLLGPNGAGKTTMVKTLLGVVEPSRGSVTLLGQPAGSVLTRQQIGYLPEHHRFPPYLKAREFLEIYGGMSGLHAKELQQRIPDMLDLVGLTRASNSPISSFSKGMQQRLGLAQAMISHPKVLFLDEPTDGVDPIGRKEIREMLLEIRSRGTTVFLNSHLLSEVELITDRVAIMNKGLIVQQGNTRELTQIQGQFVIRAIEPIPHVEQLDNYSAQYSGKEVAVNVSQDAQVSAVIDLLRSQNVHITEVNRQRVTLEDLFMQTIENHDKN